MPSPPTDQTYAEMCEACGRFVEAYRAWLARDPLPTDAALETAGSISQLRQIHSIWVAALKVEVRR